MCWEPSVVESPLQPWMIGLLCSELSKSRSVRSFDQILFQVAVCFATVFLHLLVASLWTAPIRAWPVSFLQTCQQYQGLYDSMQPITAR